MAGTTQSMTARTEAMTLGARPRQTSAQYRRQQADRAIARIEECYRRGLAIPQVR